MPEICPKSANNPHRPITAKPKPRSRPLAEPDSARARRLLRRHLFQQLTTIQINTAGLSGPYRSDKETMEHVCSNHRAVRELRRLLRGFVLVPRKGQLWNLLLTASLAACGGDVRKTAHLLGASVKQLRSSTPEHPEAKTH